MKVLHKTRDPNFYTVVGLDGPRDLTASLVNTFSVSLPVQPGDVLGAFAPSGAVSTIVTVADSVHDDDVERVARVQHFQLCQQPSQTLVAARPRSAAFQAEAVTFAHDVEVAFLTPAGTR